MAATSETSSSMEALASSGMGDDTASAERKDDQSLTEAKNENAESITKEPSFTAALREAGGQYAQWLENLQKIDDLEDTVTALYSEQVRTLTNYVENKQDVGKLFDICGEILRIDDDDAKKKDHMKKLHEDFGVDLSLLIVNAFVLDMRKWVEQVARHVYYSIDLKSHGEDMEKRLGALQNYFAMRVKRLQQIMAYDDEDDRHYYLLQSFPMLAHDDEGMTDRMWRFFVECISSPGDPDNMTVLVSSINFLTNTSVFPMSESGPQMDCATDAKFREFLNPNAWMPVYSAHLASALTYQHQRADKRQLWHPINLGVYVDDTSPTACVFDVYTLALLDMYRCADPADEMKRISSKGMVREDVHIIDGFEDKRLAFRAICRDHVNRREAYVLREMEFEEEDIDELNLVDDDEHVDEHDMDERNNKSLMAMIEPTYDFTSVKNKYGDDENGSMEKRAAAKAKGKGKGKGKASSVERERPREKPYESNNRLELKKLKHMRDTLMDRECLAHIRPLAMRAPISINTWIKMPCDKSTFERMQKRLLELVEEAVKERLDSKEKLQEYLDVANKGFEEMKLTANDDDDDDDDGEEDEDGGAVNALDDD